MRWRGSLIVAAMVVACSRADKDDKLAVVDLSPAITLAGSGDTFDLMSFPQVFQSRSGWYLVRGIASSRGHLALFDSTGKLRKIFLGTGDGPGEVSVSQGLTMWNGVGFGRGDSILVGRYEGTHRSRVMIFAPPPDPQLVRSVEMDRIGSFETTPYGLLTHPFLGAARAYPELAAKTGRSARMVGVPPHAFTWIGVEYGRFGSLTPDPDEKDVFGASTPADSTHIWSASYRRYRIDLVGTDGKKTSTIKRDVPWFPVDTVKADFPWVKPPTPRIVALSTADDELWVIITRASRNWDKHRPRTPPVMRPGMPVSAMPAYAWTDLFESVLEVFDTRSGKLLASRELPGEIRSFNRPRQLVETVEDSTGMISLKIWNAALRR